MMHVGKRFEQFNCKFINYARVKPIHLNELLLALFTFLTLFFPDSFRVVRLMIFMLLNLIVIAECGRFTVTRGTKFLIILVGSNIFFMIWGMVNNAPGALRVQTVDLLWPLLFFITSQAIRSNKRFLFIERVLFYSYFVVCLFDILYIFSSLTEKTIPGISYFSAVLRCSFGNYGTFLQYTTTHMCTHIFMVPFVISFLRSEILPIPKGWYYVTVGMSIICVLVSGRVALILTSVVCSLLGLFLISEKKRKLSVKKFFRLIAVVVGLVIAIMVASHYLGVKVESIANYVVEKFVSSNDASNVNNGVRAVQKKALIEGWMDSPFIGHGTGSYTEKSIRDTVQLWAYEYSYWALLFQKGIIGFAINFSFYGWILLTLIKKRKRGVLHASLAIPFFVGFTSIIIANYADPYMGTFGCMWMTYYPFALANAPDDKSELCLDKSMISSHTVRGGFL